MVIINSELNEAVLLDETDHKSNKKLFGLQDVFLRHGNLRSCKDFLFKKLVFVFTLKIINFIIYNDIKIVLMKMIWFDIPRV